jgi:hypothetical protein
MMSLIRFLAAGSCCVALASCGTLRTVKTATVSGFTKVSKFSVSDLFPSKVEVVKVRPKDLKELPLGKERALAYEAKKDSLAGGSGRGFWFFKGPVDFKEPTLPSDAGNLDGSLLPPRAGQ